MERGRALNRTEIGGEQEGGGWWVVGEGKLYKKIRRGTAIGVDCGGLPEVGDGTERGWEGSQTILMSRSELGRVASGDAAGNLVGPVANGQQRVEYSTRRAVHLHAATPHTPIEL